MEYFITLLCALNMLLLTSPLPATNQVWELQIAHPHQGWLIIKTRALRGGGHVAHLSLKMNLRERKKAQEIEGVWGYLALGFNTISSYHVIDIIVILSSSCDKSGIEFDFFFFFFFGGGGTESHCKNTHLCHRSPINYSKINIHFHSFLVLVSLSKLPYTSDSPENNGQSWRAPSGSQRR